MRILILIFCLFYSLGINAQFLSGLSAYYKMNETSGTTIYNAKSAGSITGAITGATVNQTGKIGPSLSFDGAGDVVVLEDTVTLQGYNSKMSFGLWIYLRSYPVYRGHIIGGETQSVALAITPTGNLQMWANGAYAAPASSLVIPLNQFVFIGSSWASTASGVADSVSYQINSSYEQFLTSTSFSINSGASSMYIGANSGAGLYSIDARIDELGIWKGRRFNEVKFDSLFALGGGLTYPFVTATSSSSLMILRHKIRTFVRYYNESIIPHVVPPIPESMIAGIFDVVGVEDYDEVCPSGQTWVTDADCIYKVLNRAPLRAIRDSLDYATVYHINPGITDPSENGSVLHPYNSLNDITLANNIAVLFITGSTYDHGTTINVSQSNILFGSYGSPNRAQPKIIRANANQRVFYITGASLKTFRDLYISNPWPSNNPRPSQQGSTSALDVSDNVEIDVFNCEMQYGWYGFRSVGIANKIRVIGCILHDILMEGSWVRASNYIEVRFNLIHDNNAYWYDQPLKDTPAGANTGSTGDGIELSGGWKQGLIANNLVDHGKTGNKSAITYHNDPIDNPGHEASITAYNILISPRNEIYDDENLTVGPNFNGIFMNNLCLASSYSPTKPNGMAMLYPGDSIVGNVYVGFTSGIRQGNGRVMANNTFINNDYALYTTGSITIPKWHNNITYGNGAIFSSGVTITSSQNNITVNPLFNPTDTNGFELLANSPAIGAGNSTIFRETDIYGTPIVLPQESGAYTFTGPKVLLIGNSVMSPIDDLIIADGTVYDVSSIAFTGHTIVQQQAEWDALSVEVKAQYNYIIVMIGLNDPGASAYIANYQALVNSINAGKNDSCILICSTMTPADPTLVNLTKWYALNIAIMGGGSTPITGVGVRTSQNTLDLDTNSNMYLDTAYDSGDGIHPNDAGDQIIKVNFLEILNSLESQ